MPSVRDKLQALLGEEDLDAEFPSAKSVVRRDEPIRLPIAQATRLCRIGQIVAAAEDGTPVAVAKLQSGTVVVLPDSCPHDGGLLSDGFVEGEHVVCARHGWEFDGHTGQCVGRSHVTLPCKPRKLPHI